MQLRGIPLRVIPPTLPLSIVAIVVVAIVAIVVVAIIVAVVVAVVVAVTVVIIAIATSVATPVIVVRRWCDIGRFGRCDRSHRSHGADDTIPTTRTRLFQQGQNIATMSQPIHPFIHAHQFAEAIPHTVIGDDFHHIHAILVGDSVGNRVRDWHAQIPHRGRCEGR